MILLLLACAGKGDTGETADSAVDTAETGESGETAETGESGESGESGETGDPCGDSATFRGILAPTDGSAIALGDTVALTGGWTGGEVYTATWEVDGVPIADTLDATWVAKPVGEHTITFTVDADCYPGSDTVTVTVVEPSSDSLTLWDSAAGVPVASWYGLSVGPDGVVWGATSAGLVRVDPTAGAVRVYTSADGLVTDYPRSVLAASDGTVWVGHVADTTRQGEQVQVEADGSLTKLRDLAIGSSEVSSVYRLREEPYGAGAGDIWMGTNEGLCLFDADLGVFVSHAHPTHPHDLSLGLDFTTDGNTWNGDGYQLSRWAYDDDGEIYSDLVEYWIPWPVMVKEPVTTSDLDADGDTLWITSSLYGVARVDVSAKPGMSTTECLGDPFPATATAIRADGTGRVWIGSGDGLRVWDTATETMVTHGTDWFAYPSVQQLAVDVGTSPVTVWAATPYGLAQIVGLPE